MPLVEDEDEVRPVVTDAQLQYVLNLDDTYKAYTRFIAALLIPRPSYAPFFRDLRSFRSQPIVIFLLSACSPAESTVTKEEIKQKYRHITTLFLQSRWSHPWCRKAAGNRDATVGSTGWWSAEWLSTGRRMSKKEKDAEDRLHQLMLPIWVIMRGRMFPGDTVVQEWWTKKLQQDSAIQKQRDLGYEKGVITWLDKLDVNSSATEINLDGVSDAASSEREDTTSSVSNNPFRKGGEHILRPTKTTPNLRQDFWDSAEAEQMQMEIERRERESAQIATSAFRLIAAGMLLSKIPKWKLRQLRKSSS